MRLSHNRPQPGRTGWLAPARHRGRTGGAQPGEPNAFGSVGAENNPVEPGKRLLSSLSTLNFDFDFHGDGDVDRAEYLISELGQGGQGTSANGDADGSGRWTLPTGCTASRRPARSSGLGDTLGDAPFGRFSAELQRLH